MAADWTRTTMLMAPPTGTDRGACMWTFSRLLTAVFDPASGMGSDPSPALSSLAETSTPHTGCSATWLRWFRSRTQAP